MTGSLTPRDLYSDDNSIYMYYPSGLNKTAIEIQQRDRFGGVTFTLLSGSVNLFIQASEYFADPNPAFISAPYTLSGESGTDLILASYVEDTPNNPENYWINLPSPGTYKVVFPNPVVSTALTVTHSGSSPYIFSQMLPRKSVGGYDIDVNAIRAYHVSATLIDTIALQVADSIVVGPELIGAKSIDGSKIIDGTISGVLIRDGTVTGNKVLAGTISGVLLQGSTITGDKIQAGTIDASKLTVTQLDAVAANMGTLVVNSGISIGTDGYIWTGTGAAEAPENGLKIYTTDGVSRLTTFNNYEVQVDIGSDGTLVTGAGTVILDRQGLTIGTITSPLQDINALKIMSSGTAFSNGGIAFFNGAYSATDSQAAIITDSTNNFVISNNVPYGNLIIGNADTGDNSIFLYNSDINIMPTANDRNPGSVFGYRRSVAGVEVLRYFLGADDFFFRNNAGQDTFDIDAATGTITTNGGIFAGTSNNKFIVAAGTGNTAIAGTLGVTGTLTANNNFLQYNYGGIYKNTAQTINAGADARITFQVSYLNGDLDDVANHRLFITHAGFYVISAGVIGNHVHTWRVVTGGNFDTGQVMNGLVLPDMRAYVTKQVYIAASTELELWVRNSGGNSLVVTTGANGTVLTAVKVG
jgi:hypothetical protein